MKYAITCVRFDHLKQAGELLRIQAEVMTDDRRALTARIFSGDLVNALAATPKLPKGERDRCYCCGDEDIPYRWKGSRYFQHTSNNGCIGVHPANPAGVMDV
jgi:hypothetical protein